VSDAADDVVGPAESTSPPAEGRSARRGSIPLRPSAGGAGGLGPTTLGCALCALALALGLGAARAEAQATSVAIAPLSGRGSGPARRAIGRALERDGLAVTMVDSDPGDDQGAAAELAAASDVDAVIGGTASRGGNDRYRVRLWVRDRAGEPAGEVASVVRGRRGLARVVDELQEVLQGVGSGSGSGDDSGSGDVPPSEAQPAASEDPPAASDEPAPPVRDEPAPAPSRPRPPEVEDEEPFPITARILVGAGVRSRSVELLSPDGTDAGYLAEPYFEVAAHGEVRFFDVAFVRARFGSSVALESDREDPALGTVDTYFVRLRADVGASYWIADTVELGAAVGLGWDRYELSFNELLPTAEYVHVRPAIVSAVRLVDRALVLEAELGLRFPFGVGDLQALHGVDHTVIGLDGVMRVGGEIEPGFTWAVEGGARRYWLTFRRPDGDVTGFDGGWHALGYAGWSF